MSKKTDAILKIGGLCLLQSLKLSAKAVKEAAKLAAKAAKAAKGNK